MVPVKGMLSICGALAAGEYLASFVPSAADVWPAVAGLAVLIALFGFGLAARGWPLGGGGPAAAAGAPVAGGMEAARDAILRILADAGLLN